MNGLFRELTLCVDVSLRRDFGPELQAWLPPKPVERRRSAASRPSAGHPSAVAAGQAPGFTVLLRPSLFSLCLWNLTTN